MVLISHCSVSLDTFQSGGRWLTLSNCVPGGRRHTIKEDGFLSPAELSLWATTMRLGEAEPQPTLGHSHFLFTKSDSPVQVSPSGSQKVFTCISSQTVNHQVPIKFNGLEWFIELEILQHKNKQKMTRPATQTIIIKKWKTPFMKLGT